MSESLELKIRELEEKNKLLQLENNDWIKKSEDVFLFAAIAESISLLNNEKDVFESSLKNISKMKDIPYCAFGTIGNGKMNIEYQYASFTNEAQIVEIALSQKLKEMVLSEKIVIKKCNNQRLETKIKFEKYDFIPEIMLIISFKNLRNQDGIFVCLDKDNKLEALKDVLSHSITLINNRIDNLQLLNQLSDQNRILELKVSESIGELEEEIKEHIRTEEALKFSEEKYRLFLENNDAVILMLNPLTGTITFANNSAVNFYGYDHDVLVGMNIRNINVLTPEEIKIKTQEALKNKQNYFIFKHKLANGDIRDVEIYQTKFIHNDEPIFSIIIHDISKRKLAEKDLTKFKLGIEHSSEAIFITEVDGTITYVNPAFEKIYGYHRDEVLGKTPRIIKSELLPKEVYVDFWNHLLKKESVSGEIINRRKDGKIITIEASNNPIIDSKEEIIGFLGIHKDISLRKNEEKELLLAKEQAESADKMKSIFLAQMSHEIRTPINALVSMSSLLRYDFETTASEDQVMCFDIMDRAGGRIIRTIDLLLNLSEIQAGTYVKNVSQFDLYSEVLSLVVAENKKIAEKKNIKLLLNSSTLETQLVADSYTVNQIFVQLIDNAIKYTNEGEVVIEVFRNERKQLIVEIKDSGIGIEEKYLPNLFDPFSQEEMGYTRKYEGNGIGMALVQKYCELNNATIEVESKKNVGTTIRVVF